MLERNAFGMLERNAFVVKERTHFLKTKNTYDILDGETGEPLGVADEQISGLVSVLRWFVSKQIMPARVEVREKPDDSLVFVVRRGAYLFRSRVEVLDAQEQPVGYFKSKLFTIGGGFHIYDKDDRHFAEVAGNLWGFNYRFLSPDRAVELGTVSKKWGGLGKELFTSADTYGVRVNPDLSESPFAKMLVLAAALAIDMIYKEESRTVGFGDTGE